MSQPLAPSLCRGVQLRVPSVTGSLPIVRAVVEKMALAQNAGEKEAGAIGLAIDEALANVIKHGYEGMPDQPIEVCIEVAEDGQGLRLIVTIRDFGRQVDPAQIQPRKLDEVRPGGLGVHIIRSVMDQVEYSCPDCGGMLLRMVKRIGCKGP
jgi:anti-sigma regulatory factor (Ser/Thr protein kinase)